MVECEVIVSEKYAQSEVSPAALFVTYARESSVCSRNNRDTVRETLKTENRASGNAISVNKFSDAEKTEVNRKENSAWVRFTSL